MRYYRAYWDESRGDKFDHWGTITFWYEVGDDGYPARHMEVYANGNVLQYGTGATDEDQYGFLACAVVNPSDLPPGSETTEDDFSNAWAGAKPINSLP